MKIFSFLIYIFPLISIAQENPYFSKQENIQMRRERESWMSNLEDYSRQPNVKFSRNTQFDNYLKNLDDQIQADKDAREAAEQRTNEETWARWERDVAIAERREAELNRIAYQKRVEELTINTNAQKIIINNAREKFKDQIQQNEPRVLALLGIISYPILPISRNYIEKAFRANPGEYSVLVAVSDFLNNPYPDSQNEFFRVIKISELSSKEGYLPFRFYSCVLIKKSLEKIKNQNINIKAKAFAEKRFENCFNALPEEYRKSPSFELLVNAQVHFQPATRDFWTDTNEGLNVEVIKTKIQNLPYLGNPKDFFQNSF